MKTLIVSLMALTLNLGNANATENSLTSNASAKSSVAKSLVTYDQLVDENRQLKLQVSVLEENTQELQSSLQYQQMMSNMFSSLEQQKQADKLEEMKAELAYNQMMASMMLQLQAKK